MLDAAFWWWTTKKGIRELVRDGLVARGARVDVAASGEEALCLLESRAYEVVICDVNLRGIAPEAISGLELHSRFANGSSKTLNGGKPLFLLMTGDLGREARRGKSPSGSAHAAKAVPYFGFGRHPERIPDGRLFQRLRRTRDPLLAFTGRILDAADRRGFALWVFTAPGPRRNPKCTGPLPRLACSRRSHIRRARASAPR